MRASFAIAALATAVSSVVAVDHLVTVGAGGVLSFVPNQVTAAQGDTVTFEFHPKNHSVGQSTFAAPCTEMAGGVTSGFLVTPTTATQFSQWQITIDNASAPLWFYCQQTSPVSHCGMGMVFAVNPTQEKTFDMYQATANATLNNAGAASAPAAPPGSTSTGAVAVGATSTAAVGGATDAQPAATSSPTDTTGNTATGVNPIAGATSGTIPTNSVPAAAAGASGGSGTAAGAAAQSSTPGSGALPRVGSAMTLSSTVVFGAVVALLL